MQLGVVKPEPCDVCSGTGFTREIGVDLNTVGELIDWLATQPRDRLVVMASDAEGNKYSPLADAEEAMYTAESTWAGEVRPTPEAIAADDRFDPDEDGAPEGAIRVVVLGPTN
jgi:hypothetical protein